MKTISLTAVVLSALALTGSSPAVTFLGRPYRLASYNQKSNPMWEFVSPSESVQNWTSLLTVVERPDAKTRSDLDRLSQGIMDTYKAQGGRILMAKTMADGSGVPFNYIIVAFEQPSLKRFELNFVKASLGAKSAVMVIYGVRVSDPRDYVSKSKAFLAEQSGVIGKELEKSALPAVEALPRKVF